MILDDLTKEEIGQAIVRGVSDAMDFWFSQHDTSTPDIIGEAVDGAVSEYLRQQGGEAIIGKAVAEAVRDYLYENGLEGGAWQEPK